VIYCLIDKTVVHTTDQNGSNQIEIETVRPHVTSTILKRVFRNGKKLCATNASDNNRIE